MSLLMIKTSVSHKQTDYKNRNEGLSVIGPSGRDSKSTHDVPFSARHPKWATKSAKTIANFHSDIVGKRYRKTCLITEELKLLSAFT